MKVKIIAFFYCLIFCFVASAQRNVILIIADDIGSDYFGFSENHLDTIPTPNIRKLLARGVRFRNAWSNPLCSPTRAGILTGRYSFRTGVGNAIGGTTSAVLDTSEITIPRLLNRFKPNGIAKANIGKWHLQLSNPNSNYTFPNKMGYDHFEGSFDGNLNSFTNWTKITNGVAKNSTNYATTENVDNAITWIKGNQNKPFFVWLAFNAPHTPYHLPPLNLHSFKTLSGTSSDITANPKAYFKASMEAVDTELGRLFESLKSIQQWDNTDIIFIGDNGNEAGVSQKSGGGGAKGSIYQEGVSVPLIIAGPSVINPNRVCDALVNTQDLFATILELFGYNNWQSQIPANKSVDSKSIMPIIKNQSAETRSWAFTEVFKQQTVAGDGKTIRNKNYKLLLFDNGTSKFFNLAKDPTEKNDLLRAALSTVDNTNYVELCKEISNLIGKTDACANTTIPPTPTVLSVENEFAHPQNIVQYPNPFNSTIKINGAETNADFELTNVFGQKIFFGKNIENQDFSQIPSGMYFLKIIDKSTKIFKLLKE